MQLDKKGICKSNHLVNRYPKVGMHKGILCGIMIHKEIMESFMDKTIISIVTILFIERSVAMYDNIQIIPYKGAKSKNPFSFRYYDKNRVIGGKTMAAHLRFAMSWWHTCNASGTDMFGGNTMDKTFGLDGIAMHKAKADFAFDLMQ